MVVIPRDGHVQVNVDIGVLVFNPWKGEVLKGKIKEQSEEGIVVDLDFVEAFIPAALTMENSYFDPELQIWVWKYEGNYNCLFILEYDLYYDNGKEIRFAVHSTDFSKIQTINQHTEVALVNNENSDHQDIKSLEKTKRGVYKVIGSWQTDGLGLSLWWEQS